MQNANWDPRFGHDPSLIKMREINTLYNRDNVRTKCCNCVVLCDLMFRVHLKVTKYISC